MVFYFSGTGNTYWVARQISEAIGEPLVNIADEMRRDAHTYQLKEYERLGFCFPTHGWQPPRIVRDFIRRSNFQAVTYVFTVTTCGDSIGETMKIFNKELQTKGFQSDTSFSVIMPESYVCLPFMYTDTPEKEHEKVENARHQLQHIIRTIADRTPCVAELTKGPAPLFFSYVIGQYFNRHMISDRKFRVDTDVCTKCGKCQRVCPVENITGTPPEWLHNGRCTCCLACYHHCPVHAINYGEITRRRGQYYFNRREGQKS